MYAPVRILCVDDSRDIADSTAMLLGMCGYDARACYDGLAALEEARSFRPAVCLIDLNMPGLDGDAVARRMRDPLAPALVAMTAMGGAETRRRTAAAGFVRHLVKPVDPQALLDAVREALTSRRAGL